MKGALLATLLVFGTCLVMPMPGDVLGDTAQRQMLETGKDFKVGYGEYIERFLKVNNSDTVTLNWKNGSLIGGTYMTILICTNSIVLEYGLINSSVHSLAGLCETNLGYGKPPYPVSYKAGNGDHNNELHSDISSPQKMKLKVASDDLLLIFIGLPLSAGDQTFNVTVAPDESGLNSRLERLTGLVAELGAELNSTRAQLELLNGQLARTDEQLASNLTELAGRMAVMNSTLGDRISDIEPYNDTPIRNGLDNVSRRLDNVSANQTVVNTTYVNETKVQPVTYVNKTVEGKAAPDYLTSAVAGVLGGVIGGIATAAVLLRRKRPGGTPSTNAGPPAK